MNFRNERIEALIPLYTGVLGALVLCALITGRSFNFYEGEAVNNLPETNLVKEQESPNFSMAVREKTSDPVIEYFRNPELKEWVIDFFTDICLNREIAEAILYNANEFDVPAALAFALSWEESNFNPNAINRSNRDGSIDRGLFQLNNRSFPALDLAVFFDIKINAYYGISHLRHCINTGGSEISALAMYNAGTTRVNTYGAPRVTLNYISRILDNRSRLESHFHTMLIKEEEKRLAEKYLHEDQPSGRTFTSAFPL